MTGKLPQASAVPYRRRGGAVEVLLVTTRKGKWIFPKGIIDPGDTAGETALKEALEEAGVRGKIAGTVLGRYSYLKWDSRCEVTVYLLEVESEEEVWEECGVRERRWCSLAEARGLVASRKLRKLLDLARSALLTPRP